MSKNVYDYCPSIENENYLLRLVKEEDLLGLFQVYSDKNAVPFFNSDNCHGDTFYYDTEEKMAAAIKFWLQSYDWRYFVRYTIIDKKTSTIMGTIEAFHRDSDDEYNNTCVIRLDLRSDFEKEDIIREIALLIEDFFFDLFYAKALVTKIKTDAFSRKKAFSTIGYKESFIPLIGQDDTEYFHYFFKYRQF